MFVFKSAKTSWFFDEGPFTFGCERVESIESARLYTVSFHYLPGFDFSEGFFGPTERLFRDVFFPANPSFSLSGDCFSDGLLFVASLKVL